MPVQPAALPVALPSWSGLVATRHRKFHDRAAPSLACRPAGSADFLGRHEPSPEPVNNLSRCKQVTPHCRGWLHRARRRVRKSHRLPKGRFRNPRPRRVKGAAGHLHFAILHSLKCSYMLGPSRKLSPGAWDPEGRGWILLGASEGSPPHPVAWPPLLLMILRVGLAVFRTATSGRTSTQSITVPVRPKGTRNGGNNCRLFRKWEDGRNRCAKDDSHAPTREDVQPCSGWPCFREWAKPLLLTSAWARNGRQRGALDPQRGTANSMRVYCQEILGRCSA